jgi:hypothetical protein
MKRTALNELVVASGGCGGTAAEDHAHEPHSSAEGGCCSEAADRAHPEHKHAKGCCGEPHAPEANRNRDADKDKGPHP